MKSPEKRSAFLDEVCGDATEFRQRVGPLLKDCEAPFSSLAQSAEQNFDTTLDRSAAPVNFPDIPAAGSTASNELDVTLPQVAARSEPVEPATAAIAQEDRLYLMGADPDAVVPSIFGQRIAQGGMGAIQRPTGRRTPHSSSRPCSKRRDGSAVHTVRSLSRGGCGAWRSSSRASKIGLHA